MIRYITKALQENDSIYVNDLGTFTKHYVSAKIDGQTLYPPHYEITLDTDIDHEEIIFNQLVCREKQCLMTQAHADILAWVEELKNALSHNKSITYEGFGTFTTHKGSISFVSDHISDINQEFEGMEAIPLAVDASQIVTPAEDAEKVEEASTIHEEKHPEEVVDTETIPEPYIEPVAEIEPVVEAETETVVEPGPEPEPEPEPVIMYSNIVTDNDDDSHAAGVEAVEEAAADMTEEHIKEVSGPAHITESGNTEITENHDDDIIEDGILSETSKTEQPAKRKRRIWPWILILLLLLVAGVLGYLLKDQLGKLLKELPRKTTIEQADESVAEAADAAVTMPADTIEEMAEDTIPAMYTPDTIRMTDDGKYPYIRFEEGYFYVIAGSFPAEKDAETHIRQTGLSKYEPCLVKQDGVRNARVCIGVFPSEEEAQAFIDSINKRYWILK